MMRHIMKKMGIIFIVLFLLLPSFMGCVGAYEWSIGVVDLEGNVRGQTSIALDSNGYPHISYSDATTPSLKYAKWTGSVWAIETVDNVPSEYMWGTCLALDSNDYAHISYHDSTNKVVKYAKWNGTGWEIETVGEGDCSSITLNTSGYPCISYYDATNEDLKYAKWNGTGWEIETVDSTGDVGISSSITLNTSGCPCIAYSDYTNDAIKYAKWNGTGWEIETVDSAGLLGDWISLVLDSNDYPHISYHEDVNVALKYAKWNGTGWEIENAETYKTGGWISMALDSNDYPHISHFGENYVNYLQYTKWNGTGWGTEIIDSEGYVGRYTSLALDSNDCPHICYGDSSNKDLKYAFKGPQISGKTKPFHGTPVIEVKNPKIETRTSGENGEYSTVLRTEGNKKYEVHFEHTPKYPKTFHAGVSLTVSANRTEVEELTIIIRGLDPTISYTVTRDGITLNPEYWSKVGSIMTIIETSFSEHTYTITPIILAGDGGGEPPPTEVGAPAVSSRVPEPQKEIATLIFSIRGWFILLFSYLGAVIICRRIGNVLIAGTLGIILPIVIMYLFKFNIFLFEWMIQATGLLGTALAAITMMMYGLIFGFIMELEVD